MSRSMLPPRDYLMTSAFIKALTGNEESKITWQYFLDKKQGETETTTNTPLAGWEHADCHHLNRKLEKLQNEGCGIFIMVNEGDGTGRKEKNVVKVRALFIDLDGAPLEPVASLLKPHIMVESSPGKYHLYWKVSDCPLDQFKPLQQAIAAKYNGDKSCVDLARVLRVPGFWHLKHEPVITTLLEIHSHAAYTTSEIIAGLGISTAEAMAKESLGNPSMLVLPSRKTTIDSLPLLNHSSSIPSVNIEDTSDRFEFIDQATGEVFNLKEFAVKNPDFQIATALREHLAQVVIGEEVDGMQHIVCPFEDEHTRKGSDRATICINGTSTTTKGFVINCLHDHCIRRDRLDFLKRMLLKGWLPPDVLSDRSLVILSTPEWCSWHEADFVSDPRVQSLDHKERVYWRTVCTMMLAKGSLPDNDWMIARNFGLSEEEWHLLKTTYVKTGLLVCELGHLINRRAQREFNKARDIYDKKVRGGRKGGSSKSPHV